MAASYVVRLIETKEIIGFFVVDSPWALHDFIDTLMDAALCECAKLGSPGGIYVGASAAASDSWEPEVTPPWVTVGQWNDLDDDDLRWESVLDLLNRHPRRRRSSAKSEIS